MIHQYIDRNSSAVVTEKLYADRLIRGIYSHVRENAGVLFKALTSSRSCDFLSCLVYDPPAVLKACRARQIIRQLGIDLSECVDPGHQLDTPKKVFERKIRYLETRPMTDDAHAVVSPADSKMLAGSFENGSPLFIKEKFFQFNELIGPEKTCWLDTFSNGDFAVFRLTPDKYHYNHVPVSGKVLDIYEIDGAYHSCNPAAVIAMATPFSKNKRVITVIDTDIDGGTRVGRVAMIEVAALMIGDIVQCYSDTRYDGPKKIAGGMLLKKGAPKSLYRPGSSLDVLIFEKDKVEFCPDIVLNMNHGFAKSRFSEGFGRPLVETGVAVRSTIAGKRS